MTAPTSSPTSRAGLEARLSSLEPEEVRWTLLDYLTGKVKTSPRNEFFYVNDDGQIVALRYQDWKAVFLENRGQGFVLSRRPRPSTGPAERDSPRSTPWSS
mgnify:CR=1 FL=1